MATEDEAYTEGETLAEVEGRRLRVVHCGSETAVYAERMWKDTSGESIQARWQVDPEAGISIPDEHLASFIACLSCIEEANARPKELEEEES